MQGTYDLVVIGAGPHGLIAAHTWLELHPTSNIAILESEQEIGGTWAKSRIYPGMMTQSPVRKIEWSVYQMPPPDPESSFYELMPGSHVCAYLEAFSRHKSWSGKTMHDRVKFGFHVESVSWNEVNGKRVYAIRNSTSDGSVTCRKLIVATGLTNIPHLPAFPVSPKKAFTPPIIHSKHLAQNSDLLLSPAIQNVVVVGGAKSAFDTVQMLLRGNKSVTWLIRPSGSGPACMADSVPPPIFGLKNSSEMISTRFVSKLSPSIFEPVDAWAKLWHQNWLGIAVSAVFWKLINFKWLKAAGYDKDERLRELKPTRSVFYVDTIGVVNSRDMWGTVANAKVVKKGIEELYGNEVVLDGGKRVQCDALVACTGWDDRSGIFTAGQSAELGLPVDVKEESASSREHWEELISAADREVLVRFPRLKEQPDFPKEKKTTTQAKLYRSMVPTNPAFSDGSITFLGHFMTRDTWTMAEVQALWAVAFMSGKVKQKTKEEMEKDVALVIAWRRRRYLEDGNMYLFDGHEYHSQLLRDMGLNDVRKAGKWKELFSPYDVNDYKGLMEEWKAL